MKRQEQKGQAKSFGTEEKQKVFLDTLEECSQSLYSILTTLLDAAIGVEKVNWADVILSGDQVSKQATTAGVLWCEHVSATAGKENIKSYSRALEQFLLLCHGSTVGAGVTLLKAIHLSAKQVLDSSIALLRKAISLSGETFAAERKAVIPQFVGCVWDACNALKKTPTSNSVAIGRSLTQIAASVKDVIRELQELKENDDSTTECRVPNDSSNGTETENSNCSDAESLGSLEIDQNLSPREMKVAQSVKSLIFSVIEVLKQLLYFYGRVTKHCNDNGSVYLCPLEKILVLCQEISVQVDELGASCYPPQETEQLRVAAQKLRRCIAEIQIELQKIENLSEAFESATREVDKCIISLIEVLGDSSPEAAES